MFGRNRKKKSKPTQLTHNGRIYRLNEGTGMYYDDGGDMLSAVFMLMLIDQQTGSPDNAAPSPTEASGTTTDTPSVNSDSYGGGGDGGGGGGGGGDGGGGGGGD